MAILLATKSSVSALRRAFGDCIGTALAVLGVFNNELGPLGVLSYPPDVVLGGSRHCWGLEMVATDLVVAHDALERTATTTAAASTGPTDMAGYASRLFKTLIQSFTRPTSAAILVSAAASVALSDVPQTLNWDSTPWEVSVASIHSEKQRI